MKDENQIEEDTAINSPFRRSEERLLSTNNEKKYELSTTFRPETTRLSMTEQQMYSHRLIKQLMETNRQKSVQHNISCIDQEIVLYSKPVKNIKDQFKFDSIPSRSKIYSSPCYAKINQIKQGLRSPKTADQEKCHNKKEPVKIVKKRPHSATGRIDAKHPKICVGVLADYNFNSVKAGKSLGFNKIDHQQNLIANIIDADRRKSCAIQRRDKILGKTSGLRLVKHKKVHDIILNDFASETKCYLAEVVQEKEDNTLIYNEKAKKLIYIKEYMAQEKVPYEQAAFIVNEIEGRKKREKPIVVRLERREELNDESLLEGRRMPMRSKSLQVRHFTFIE